MKCLVGSTDSQSDISSIGRLPVETMVKFAMKSLKTSGGGWLV